MQSFGTTTIDVWISATIQQVVVRLADLTVDNVKLALSYHGREWMLELDGIDDKINYCIQQHAPHRKPIFFAPQYISIVC